MSFSQGSKYFSVGPVLVCMVLSGRTHSSFHNGNRVGAVLFRE